MNLASEYSAVFARVLSILERDDGPEADSAESARRQLLADMDAAAERAAARHDAKTLFLARRLVTAWADERLSSDDWSGREQWLAHPLQSDWLEGRRSGEWFFETAEALNPGNPEHGELAALCLRCLTLGLDGRLHGNDGEILDLRHALTTRFHREAPPGPFPPPLGAVVAPPRKGRGLGRAFAVLLVGAVLFAALYCLGRERLDGAVEARFHGVGVHNGTEETSP